MSVRERLGHGSKVLKNRGLRQFYGIQFTFWRIRSKLPFLFDEYVSVLTDGTKKGNLDL